MNLYFLSTIFCKENKEDSMPTNRGLRGLFGGIVQIGGSKSSQINFKKLCEYKTFKN